MDKRDLEAQLAAYARQLDEAAPGVEALAPTHEDADPGSVPPVVPLEPKRRRVPDWAFAGAAAAVVVVLIGSVAVLAALRSNPDDPAATAPPSSTTSTTTSQNTPGPRPESPAVLVSDAPVIGSETVEEGDPLRFFTLGDVVESDGQFHALLGVRGEASHFVHAWSQDGSIWTVDETSIAIDGSDGIHLIRATTLRELSDGTWVGYFDAWADLGQFGYHRYKYWIHRGTAPDIAGPWTVDPTPVLESGADGAWDAGWVRHASVLPSDSGWTMHYLGAPDLSDDDDHGQIGMATSEDGIVWSKAAAPVLVADPESRFERGGFNHIQVKFIDDEYLMSFAGATGGNRGLATSPDGVAWTRDSRNPVLTNLQVPRASIHDTALVDDDGTIRWYVVAGGFESMAVYELRLDL